MGGSAKTRHLSAGPLLVRVGVLNNYDRSNKGSVVGKLQKNVCRWGKID